MSRHYRKHIGVSTVHTAAPRSHTIGANFIKNLSLYIPRLKYSKMLATIVGLIGDVGCTEGH